MVNFDIAPSQTFYLDWEDWLEDKTLALIHQELDEFSAVLGVKASLGKAPEGEPQWVIREDADLTLPTLTWEADQKTLTSAVRDRFQVVNSLSLLQSLAHANQNTVSAEQPSTVEQAIALLDQECRNTYPSFALRGLDWEALLAEAMKNRPSTWEDFGPWAMKLVAKLGDGHTAVIDSRLRGYHPPYLGTLESGILTLTEVPPYSAAAQAGVKAQWTLDLADPQLWESVTGATPQQFRALAARNALSITTPERTFSAHNPDTQQTIEWVEKDTQPRIEEIFQKFHPDPSTVYVKLTHFLAGLDIKERFEKLCQQSAEGDTLILDLRGNSGGNIMLASTLRNMFLRQQTLIGYSSFTDGRGGLSPLCERWVNPHPSARWKGKLQVLVDAMTYSASEDFLLGLQGLDHVSVWGSTTGGGSGRPRTLLLGPHLSLHISTAITYDRHQEPVEYRGIEPDGSIPETLEEIAQRSLAQWGK